MLERAFKVLEPMFIEQVLPASGHGLLADSTQWKKLLESLPESVEYTRELLLKRWAKVELTSAERWEELKMHLSIFLSGNSKSGASKAAKNMQTKERERIENWPAETVFRYTYPRLDVNVSKMRNHLLKSPFCVHPKTGRVCVPILAAEIDSFDPFTVPTLAQLMKELDANANDSSAGPEWQKTSLKGYFEPFEKQFLEPLAKKLRRQERDAKEQEAAMSGDF